MKLVFDSIEQGMDNFNDDVEKIMQEALEGAMAEGRDDIYRMIVCGFSADTPDNIVFKIEADINYMDIYDWCDAFLNTLDNWLGDFEFRIYTN